MAVYRQTPTCNYCGKSIAKAIYRDQSHLPTMLRVIGDTFIRWDYKKCKCKGAKKARKEMKKSAIKLDINKFLNKDK